MRRPLVTSTFALALALMPAALFAQTPPAQPPAQPPPATAQPPAQPPPATAQPPAAAPAAAAPKLPFTTDAGLLLITIKADQTAAFEELVAKLKSGLEKSTDATLKQQASGWKVYKSSEGAPPNALYVILIDPAVKAAEYDLFQLLQKTMTEDELRAPGAQDMFKKFIAAFAAGYNKLGLTPVK